MNGATTDGMALLGIDGVVLIVFHDHVLDHVLLGCPD